MKRIIWIVLALTGMLATGFSEPVKGKYAIILHAGNETNEGKSRAVHALLYARDLAEHGNQVVLIFDGAGTGWPNELRKPENPFHKQYVKLQELGTVVEICDFCADTFGVKKEISKQQQKLLAGDYEGHTSISKWANNGYTLIVL